MCRVCLFCVLHFYLKTKIQILRTICVDKVELRFAVDNKFCTRSLMRIENFQVYIVFVCFSYILFQHSFYSEMLIIEDDLAGYECKLESGSVFSYDLFMYFSSFLKLS